MLPFFCCADGVLIKSNLQHGWLPDTFLPHCVLELNSTTNNKKPLLSPATVFFRVSRNSTGCIKNRPANLFTCVLVRETKASQDAHWDYYRSKCSHTRMSDNLRYLLKMKILSPLALGGCWFGPCTQMYVGMRVWKLFHLSLRCADNEQMCDSLRPCSCIGITHVVQRYRGKVDEKQFSRQGLITESLRAHQSDSLWCSNMRVMSFLLCQPVQFMWASLLQFDADGFFKGKTRSMQRNNHESKQKVPLHWLSAWVDN